MKKVVYTLFIFAAVAVGCGGGDSSEPKLADPAKDKSEESKDDMSDMEGPALLEVPEGARVYFANIEDGDTLTNPVIFEFGVEGMKLKPAGELKQGEGHHHLLINEDVIAAGETVPANETNIHYGGAQTGDTLDLPAGNHTLVMQFADGLHRSYGEPMSATVNVVVAE